MKKAIKELSAMPGPLDVFGPDPLSMKLRSMVGELIGHLVAEELEAALSARRYQRVEESQGTRAGYRHGSRTREVVTSAGTAVVTVPRGRLFVEGNASQEWRSALIPRYQRRARAVDDSVLAAYLGGTNTRRIRGALRPILKDSQLSKSAVSRVVVQLKGAFRTWRTSRLEDKEVAYLFLDAIGVKVRSNRRVENMNVLVALGVMEDGSKEVLGLELMASESTASWSAFVDELSARGLRAPVLCIIDGSAGLHRAVKTSWPAAAIQRCVVHKLRNLEAHCPKRALDDLRRDFHTITEAASAKAAHQASEYFKRVWSRRCEGVVNSLDEAGAELLTFYGFPKSQWKCLRTTNSIERLHLEFRRRIKTQASFPTESSVLYLLFGLYQSGQIRMRKIDGWKEITGVVSKAPSAKKAAA